MVGSFLNRMKKLMARYLAVSTKTNGRFQYPFSIEVGFPVTLEVRIEATFAALGLQLLLGVRVHTAGLMLVLVISPHAVGLLTVFS